ncbi:MAG TPA: ROK family protein [bacterium]|nr:ROK family protein [bacterium]HPN30530.1 ROK family protein [bacterium]
MKNKKINIGIDIGGSHIGLALVNEKGDITFKTSFKNQNLEPETMFIEILKSIVMLNNKSIEYNKTPVGFIGIGIPGIINIKDGIIENSPNLPKLKGFKISEYLISKLKKQKITIPLQIENDANCAALAENKFGWGKYLKKDNLIHLTLGSGIGGGIIFNGKIYNGCSNNAGEIGHMTISFDGRKCGCGNTGCLEAYAGTPGFIKTIIETVKQKENKNSLILKYSNNNFNFITPELVARAAKKKDKTAIELFEDYGKILGIGISNLINVFNIELITLGGGISQSGNLFLKGIANEVKKRAFKIPAEKCSIKTSRLGADAGMIGASALY